MRVEQFEDRLCPDGNPVGAPPPPAPAVDPLLVTTHLDVVDANDNLISLREAIKTANDAVAGQLQTINFAPAVYNKTIDTTSTLELKKTITINGLGTGVTIARVGLTDFGLFVVDQAAVVQVSGLTFQQGGGGTVTHGGAILTSGSLSLQDCNFYNNNAAFGGAIAVVKGSLNVANTTIDQNSTWMDDVGFGYGAGIYVGDKVTSVNIAHSTISSNYARYGGGGIWVDVPTVGYNPDIYISDTSIILNEAGFEGGGIGVRQHSTGGTPALTLTGNTLISGNQLTETNSKGGGLFLGRGSVYFNGVTFAYNFATTGTGFYAAVGTTGTEGPNGVEFIGDNWFVE